MLDFAHLHVHSHYSFLDGLAKIPDIVNRVKELCQTSVALTDHGNMHGVIEFYTACREARIKPIIGLEAYMSQMGRFDKSKRKGEKAFHHITLLAKNNQGYHNLLRLSTLAYTEGFYYKPRIDMELLSKYSEGVICLTGCMSSILATDILGGGNGSIINNFRETFKDDVYLEIQRTDAEGQDNIVDAYQKLSKDSSTPLVATNDVHYIYRRDSRPHEALLCIGTGTNLSDPKRFRFSSEEYYIKSTTEMSVLFSDIPEAIKETSEIAIKCNVNLDFSPKRVYFPLDGRYTAAHTALTELCEHGKAKLQHWSEEYEARLQHELKVISDMELADYILIVQDFIRYARRNAIQVGGGRGSSAGSLVCYLTDITEVDPISHSLVFERFINPERVSFPDIDVDVAPDRRHEVIKYLKDKYGHDRVAQIATYGSLKTKQVIKDCFRVMQFPWGAADKLCSMLPEPWVDKNIDDALKLDGFRATLKRMAAQHYDEFIHAARALEGKYRHVSKHAAGVVISSSPLVDSIPLMLSRDKELISQYDMHAVERVGLIKFDLLGLKAVAVIDNVCKQVGIQQQEIPLDDTRVYQSLRQGRTAGVFQYEGYNITKFIRSYAPEKFEDLVNINALYRPGPLDSGMAYDCVRRRHNPKAKFTPPNDIAQIVAGSGGIILFQEQVIKIATDIAGMPTARADMLRHSMGKKIKKEMQSLKNEFINGCITNGTTRPRAVELFSQIETFARYGWNKAHAVAYSLISYRTAYLKCHYPLEFYTEMLNYEHDSSKQERLMGNARKQGIEIVEAQINVSGYRFVSKDGRIYKNLQNIKGVGDKAAKAIIEERKKAPYKDPADFRTRVSPRSVNSRLFETLLKNHVFRRVDEPVLVDVTQCDSSDLRELLLACKLSSGDRELLIKYGSLMLSTTHKVQLTQHFKDSVQSITGRLIITVGGHDGINEQCVKGTGEQVLGKGFL